MTNITGNGNEWVWKDRRWKTTVRVLTISNSSLQYQPLSPLAVSPQLLFSLLLRLRGVSSRPEPHHHRLPLHRLMHRHFSTSLYKCETISVNHEKPRCKAWYGNTYPPGQRLHLQVPSIPIQEILQPQRCHLESHGSYAPFQPIGSAS